MFYDYLDSLCAEKGMTVTELLRTLGISPSSASRWKSKGYEPSRATAKKIADFFGLTVAELLSCGNKEQKEKPLINGDEELTEYLEQLRTRPEMRMLFSISKNATKEDVERAVAIIEALRKTEENKDR